MRTTIKDVAKKAQVSQATVSLVLNDGPGVSTATREAVRIVMRETNFRPDALARSLSSRRSETIALVMPPNIASLGDPYFTNLMCGVLEGVRNRGYKMLLEIADDRFMQQRLWEELFLCKRIDGLIVATPQLDHDYLSQLTVTDHPVLLINGARPDLPGIDFVGYDDLRCGREATEHLIGLGHRRIGHLCGPDNQASALARREGFVQAMEKAGLPICPEDVMPGDYWHDSARASMRILLQRPASKRPTALYCANDTLALAAMQVAQAAGLSVPGDFSVIGVDDTGEAKRADPPLTTMRQDVHAISSRAAALFLKKLKERTLQPIREYVPMTLIERGTCGGPGVRERNEPCAA